MLFYFYSKQIIEIGADEWIGVFSGNRDDDARKASGT